MKPIRTAAKAIVIRDGRLLVTVNRDPDGVFYLLPGGGQEPGETLLQALRRECREEIGADVEIGDLVFVREYIGAQHEFTDHDGDVHQIELLFVARLPDGEIPGAGMVPDTGQTGIAWLPIAELPRLRLYPAALAEPLRRLSQGALPGPHYLGDVN
ncbi:MAG: NUDIX domain-containing protein [Candidatus Acetothermia bacterium]|jgi:ADP-ribose pyrophosphatase YjhB (NUDIX family)|nr:NUDIX domain-containing protein [Candidatus Acetothermia bacterium]